MSQTYDLMDETYAEDGEDQTKAGLGILLVTGFVAACLVIAGLIYATGTSARHKAALAVADCVPSDFISGLPCATHSMLIREYAGMVTPAGNQMSADMAAYRANENHHLAAAEAVLSSAVATEQALANSLAAVTFTPQNRATADRLITGAEMIGNPVPMAAVTFTPQMTVIANALIQADQALATLTGKQAKSSSLTQLRSFNPRVDAASATVQTDMKLLLAAIGPRPTASQEP
jgi:hypothetical protein